MTEKSQLRKNDSCLHNLESLTTCHGQHKITSVLKTLRGVFGNFLVTPSWSSWAWTLWVTVSCHNVKKLNTAIFKRTCDQVSHIWNSSTRENRGESQLGLHRDPISKQNKEEQQRVPRVKPLIAWTWWSWLDLLNPCQSGWKEAAAYNRLLTFMSAPRDGCANTNIMQALCARTHTPIHTTTNNNNNTLNLSKW